MSLQGNLTDLPVEDLLQVFTMQHRCGVLFVSYNQYRAEVCFGKVALHSALIYYVGTPNQTPFLQGLNAVFEVLSWPEGQFYFEMATQQEEPANIFTSVDYIILEHYRRRDEQAKQCQWLNFKPTLLPNPPVKAQINLELDEWRVLLQINGIDSIGHIAVKLRQASETLLLTLKDLQRKGLIELMPTSSLANTPAYVPAGRFDNNGESYQHTQYDATLAISYHYRATTVSSGPLASPARSTSTTYYDPEEATAHLTQLVVPALPVQPRPIPALPAALSMPRPSLQPKPKVRRGLLSSIIAKIRGL